MTDKAQTEARVAAGGLVVSFSGGDAPKTWRADMAQISTASFELKEDGKKYVLVMKTRDAAEDIYAFADRDGAANALQTVTSALFAQQATLLPHHSAPKVGFLGKLARVILYLVVAALCLLVVRSVVKTHQMDFDPASLSTGVPMSADKMLSE